MSDLAIGELRIMIGTAGARLWRDSTAGPVIADDDNDQWDVLRGKAACAQQVVVVIADDASLPLALPWLPHDDGELRRLLDEWAPLRSRDLVFTRAIAGEDGKAPTVVLVRKTWLDQRIHAIAAKLKCRQFAITDERGNEFLQKPPTGVHGRKFAVSAMLALAVLLMLGALWWFGGLPTEQPQRGMRIQANSVAEPKQSSPAAVSSIHRPSSLALQPSAAASAITQARHRASDIVLIGVVGRLPDDAQVLVRPAWGKTVTLRAGDSLLGWRLISIAPDSATFDREGERAQIRIEPR